jgi:hypothetical protein
VGPEGGRPNGRGKEFVERKQMRLTDLFRFRRHESPLYHRPKNFFWDLSPYQRKRKLNVDFHREYWVRKNARFKRCIIFCRPRDRWAMHEEWIR